MLPYKSTLLFAFFLGLFGGQGLLAQPDDRLQTVMVAYDSQFVSSPTLSAILIGKGDLEINYFSGLQSRELIADNLVFNFEDFTQDTLRTQTQISNLDHILQLQFGLSDNFRLNAGIDLFYSHARFDADPNGSLFRLFSSATPNTATWSGFSAIGPRVRWMPFPSIPELTVQTSLVFGLGSDENRAVFGRRRTQALAQVVFYQQFGGRFTAFGQLDASYFFRSETQDFSSFSFPLFTYLSAQLSGFAVADYPKVFTFASFSYNRLFDSGIPEDGTQARFYAAQLGLGASLQWAPTWSVLLFLQSPISSGFPNPGGDTISASQQSWVSLTVGVRKHILQ